MDRLGLNETDFVDLTLNVDVIIHSAACVKFDKSLPEMIESNFMGTYRILELAKACYKLKVFIYISTAFSQFNKTATEERYYPCFMDPMKIVEICKKVDNDKLDFLMSK